MVNTRFSLANRNVLVTGASSGIGRVVAEQLAAEGARVTVCSRTKSDLEPVVNAIDETGTGKGVAVECNVRDRDSVERMVDAAVEEFGPLDILINNAGGDFASSFEDISPNGWQAVVDVNLNGTYHCTQVAGESMRSSGGGSIVNIASMYGLKGAKNHAHYSASKAAVINLTEVLAAEWAEHSIRVNAVAPGFVLTPGLEQAVDTVSADSISRETVNRQIGTPEEIADVIQFLASPAASYVTGSTVRAMGVPDIEATADWVEAAEEMLHE